MRATGPGEPAQLLLDVADALNNLQVPYAIIGALAVAYYGVPRYTGDGDAVVWLKDSGKKLEDLNDHFLRSGFRAKMRLGDFEDPILASIRIEDEFENRVDLLAAVRGMDPEAVHRCISAPMLDSTVHIVAAEDLIGLKLFAGGPQDRIDVQSILQVWRERLNADLLKQVCRRYGADVSHTLDELLEEFPIE